MYQYLDKQESVANAATAINCVSLLDESLSDTSSTQLLTPCGEVFEPKQTCRMSGCVTLNVYNIIDSCSTHKTGGWIECGRQN